MKDVKKDSNESYFNFNEVFRYYFRKKDRSKGVSINLKLMHGINKISIIMFIIALFVIIYRYVSRSFF